jgi:BASS family bile acid:Na+ symporter
VTPAGRVLRGLWPLHERLPVWVVVAAVVGVAFPGAAHAGRWGVPVMLGGQVLGVALTLKARRFLRALQRPGVLLGALAVQWVVLPLAGYGLLVFLHHDTVGVGALVTAASPAEITSALVALLAVGDGALAATVMAASVASSAVLTPLWVAALLGSGHHVDRGGLVVELALSVALPLVAGTTVRTRWPAVARLDARWLDLAGLSLVLVVFVGAGSARPMLSGHMVGPAVAAAAALVVVGALVGGAVGMVVPGGRRARVAVAFPVAMREFGIATAVLLVVAPASAGFAGVYGIVLMLGATAAAGALRRWQLPAGADRVPHQRTDTT